MKLRSWSESMTKLIGALLLIASGAALGIHKYMSLRGKTDMLAGVIASLELMRGEIRVRLTPLPELVAMLTERGDGDARGFFKRISSCLPELSERSFSSIWRGALPALGDLGGDEFSALAALGDVLGRFDANEQEAAINRAITELSLSLERERERLRAAPKMYIGLGLSFGAMIAAALF